MALPAAIAPKDKDRDRPLDGSGAALEEIMLDPTTKTGTDQEIAHNLPDHILLPKTIMPWIHLLLSTKPQMTKNVRNTTR